MNFSPGLKRFALVLLPLLIISIAWKVSAMSRVASHYVEPNDKIINFLSRNQVQVKETWQIPGGTDVVRGLAGKCPITVALTSPRGWDRDMVRKLAAPGDRMFVVFRGDIYDEQPMIRTVSDFLWTRLLSEFGVDREPSLVIAVVAQPGCSVEQLPWREIQGG